MPQSQLGKTRLVRAVLATSRGVAVAERVAASILIGLVALLILLNVFTRFFGYALYWVDEAAIYAMVWATLVAGSLCVHQRQLISVTLLEDVLPPRARRGMLLVSDLIVLVFAGYCIWLNWIWFAPADFARAGFDIGTFVIETGNFIYGEPTNTLGIRKVWIWLIMPVFAITLTTHALANVFTTLITPSDESNADAGEVIL